MLDLIEYQIAERLSEHHLYPYGRDIYIKIFRHFSQFPLRLEDLAIKGEGQTITFLAYVVMVCLDGPHDKLLVLYQRALDIIQQKVVAYSHTYRAADSMSARSAGRHGHSTIHLSAFLEKSFSI